MRTSILFDVFFGEPMNPDQYFYKRGDIIVYGRQDNIYEIVDDPVDLLYQVGDYYYFSNHDYKRLDYDDKEIGTFKNQKFHIRQIAKFNGNPIKGKVLSDCQSTWVQLLSDKIAESRAQLDKLEKMFLG